MKKFASIALIAALVLSLCACGRKNKPTEPTTTTTVPPTTYATIPSIPATTEIILPDPTLDSLFPDSGLLDTSENTEAPTDSTTK